jgi:NitT/TauT family transport system substrate-binding protein
LFLIGGLLTGGSINESLAKSKSKKASGKNVKTKRGKSKKKVVKKVIKVGYFPNITHSQALVGLARGEFQKALGKNVSIETKVFNAGPSEIEALFANEIDIGYIGPNPAINGYIKSQGVALRVIAGATSGGAAFVVRNDSNINEAKDLAGKKIASPQLGNTQDVALRFYLQEKGFKLKEKGGNVEVIPIENPDILTLFQKKELDGAWVPEPWASRLVKQGNGRIFVDERTLWPNSDFVTANIIVSLKFLKENPDLVKKWLKGHVETTIWINKNKPNAQLILNEEIKKITGKSLPEDVLSDAFARLTVTWDPIKDSLFKSADNAFELGFIKNKDLKEIYHLKPLNNVLKEKKLNQIK